MKDVVLDKKIVICPNCQGCGAMAHYDTDRERCKLVSEVCGLCQGSGRVYRRVKIEYLSYDNDSRINELKGLI